ncbi:hypothetical protein IWQ56_002822 [Coemansia nantahalensis]|uniref:Uncharacterized protein n=2 Tax=Coemansia TaxID=4863 RepID=A0ACC1KRX6_9FUNG|nr:hypothetical protein IWQ57_005477 [Coemansia nantahalensis]KAJ2768747.1 hypothetical protein IWQ56_002822 [Coemansia nantahalensis]KAJ2793969.1 hypothetical protein H4R21_005686 [Coemansia helicoidea]
MDSTGDTAKAGVGGARAFDNQVAGHGGMLAVEGGEMVIKPLCQREQLFYEGAAQWPELRSFMPTYFGKLHRGGPEDGGDGDEYLCLENVVHGFEQPCIMDVKIGRRTWDLDATEEKRARAMEKVAARTAGTIGLAICGMKLDGEPAADRDWCRQLTEITLPAAIARFFAPAAANVSTDHRAYIIGQFILEAEELLAAVEEAEVRMYGSSLLFVYDASRARSEQVLAGGGGGLLDLRMIDFAHSHWLPGRGRDDNYIDGLRNVLRLLRSLLDG